MRVLLTLVWLLAAVYATIPAFWIAVHPFAGRWRARNKNPFPALMAIWLAMIITALLLTWHWCALRVYSTPFVLIPAAILFAGASRVY